MKTQKVSSTIPLKRVGIEIWNRVQARKKRNPGESTNEAFKAVSKAHPALYKRYVKAKRGPWIGRAADDMDFLVGFLNSPSGAEMREMLDPIVNWQQTPLETQRLAAEKLASRLSAIDTRCYTHITNGMKPYFYWSASGHPFYERVAKGLQTRDFWKLRQCPECKRFFVAEDHRRRTCLGKQCSTKRANSRATKGMEKLRDRERKEATNQLCDFIGMCQQEESILDTMSYEGTFESMIEKIRNGIEKGWTAKKIVRGLSGRSKGWILKNKQDWISG